MAEEQQLIEELDGLEISKESQRKLKESGVRKISDVSVLREHDLQGMGLNLVEIRKLQQPRKRTLTMDPKEKIVGLKLNADMYDAVVMAAFGGVTVRLPGNRGRVAIHPSIIFLFTTALSLTQYTLLTCLMLDLEVEDKGPNRWWVATWEEFDRMPGRRILLCSKVLMTLVLQMIVMKELIGCFRPLAFICNPYTWNEMRRPVIKPLHSGDFGVIELNYNPETRDWFDAYCAIWCAPWCFASELLQFLVAYGVLNLSMSVILNCGKVSDVMLNGLAITFMLDLDDYAWAVLAPLFHIDEKYYNDFDIEVLEDEKAKSMIKKLHERIGLAGSRWEWLSKWCYRSNEGKVEFLENVVQVLALPFLFLRQVLVFVGAMAGGVLPLSKDICNFIALKTDTSLNFFRLVDAATPVNFSLALDNLQNRTGFRHIYTTDNCTSDAFHALPGNYFPKLKDYVMKEGHYQECMILTLVATFLIFIVPQVIYGLSRPLQQCFGKCCSKKVTNYLPLAQHQ